MPNWQPLLICLPFIACLFPNQSRGVEQPLAEIDFATGQSRNVSVMGTPPPVVEIDGQRVAQLSIGRVSMQMDWPADMPNPGLPGMADVHEKTTLDRPRLLLDLDESAMGVREPVGLAFVITVYDYCRGGVYAEGTTVRWATGDVKTPRGESRFALAGDPYAADPLARPRFIRKTVLAPKVMLKNDKTNADVEISPEDLALIQRIEVYRLSSSVQERWQKSLADLMVKQAQAYATWNDAETTAHTLVRHLTWNSEASKAREIENDQSLLRDLADKTAVAMDTVFYEGKVALVCDDPARYETFCEEASDALAKLVEASVKSQQSAERAHSALAADKGVVIVPEVNSARDSIEAQPSILDRVHFHTFANSPWESWDPFNGMMRSLAEYGIETKAYVLAGIQSDSRGELTPESKAFLDREITREHARGSNVAIIVGHHSFHLCEHGGLPDWLAKKSAPQSLYDIGFDGKPAKYMDMWNPHVRQYFLDTVTALARETAARADIVPWYCFDETECGAGYSPAARRAFAAHLRAKYSDIAKLNSTWGTSYASFDEIKPPPPPGDELRTHATGLAYEFEKFRADSFVQWWRDTSAALRKGNPKARLWLEGHGRLNYLLYQGLDQLGIFEAADVSAVHAASTSMHERVWALSLSRLSGTPWGDGEVNTYGDYYNGFASLDQLRAAAEQHLVSFAWYGARQFVFYADNLVTTRAFTYQGPRLYDASYLAPLSLSSSAMRVVRRKTDLYNAIVKSTQPVHPQVGVLFSSTSFINSWPYNEVEHETFPLHSWLHQSDFGYFYTHEDAIIDGRENLSEYKVIFAPWAAWMRPEAAKKLLDWVNLGGVLIASGPVGAFDEYGRPLNTLLDAAIGKVDVSYGGNERLGDNRLSDESVQYLRSIGDTNTTHFGGWFFNITPKEKRSEVKTILSLADGTPVVYEAAVGKGKLILSTGPIGKNALRRFAMREIERRVTPLVRKVRNDGFHVLPRTDDRENLFLGVFNSNVRERVTDTLYVYGHYSNVIDKTVLGDWPVPTRYEHDRTAIELTLAPGEATVLFLGSTLPPSHRQNALAKDAPPEESLAIWDTADLKRGREEIAAKKLDAVARAQAEALLQSAERQAAAGYVDRGRQLIDLARRVDQKPAVFSPRDSTAAAHRMKGAVKIDGIAEEWRNVPRYQVKGIGDEGGEFALQWDDTTLYVLVVSRDKKLRKNEELGSDANWIWQFDGLNLVLNTSDFAPPTSCGTLYDAKFRATQTALLVSITGRKYADSSGAFSAAAVRSAVGEIPGGYVMEVAIPLRDIMLPPIAGANIGMELRIVNDGREMGFGEFSGREGWYFDPLHFSRLTLVEK